MKGIIYKYTSPSGKCYIGQYDSYKSGYNQTIGGHSLRGSNHPSFGHKLSEKHKEKLKASICRQVSQYSISGEYIDSYDSAAQAGLSTETDASGIIAVCKGKQQTAGGFQWRYGCTTYNIGEVKYKERLGQKKYGKENPRSKQVYQYTLD